MEEEEAAAAAGEIIPPVPAMMEAPEAEALIGGQPEAIPRRETAAEAPDLPPRAAEEREEENQGFGRVQAAPGQRMPGAGAADMARAAEPEAEAVQA